jgi:bile acid:Na+ symporter, BASS family
MRLLSTLSNAFPLWIVLGCLWAWFQPGAWTWFKPWIEPGLGVIMLGMGLTLRFADFAAVLRRPWQVALGVAAQFLIMPFAAWGIATVFRLEAGLAIGLILVGCCPGGTASNVICYIFATPLLTRWLAGAWLPVDAWALFRSMLIVVLLPLVCGITANTLLERMRDPGRVRKWIDAIGPLLSVAVIVLIVSCVVGLKKPEIARSAGQLFICVFLLHFCGFLLGYLFAMVAGCGESLRRTVSIEVGMQNSGLGGEAFPSSRPRAGACGDLRGLSLPDRQPARGVVAAQALSGSPGNGGQPSWLFRSPGFQPGQQDLARQAGSPPSETGWKPIPRPSDSES